MAKRSLATKPTPARAGENSARRGARRASNLDSVIHGRVRLGMVSALAVSDSLTFNELKSMLRVTDGNLSAHARRLEAEGYVECRKTFAGRTPRTSYSLTAAGRKALQRYLAHMEALIHATREGESG